MRSTPWRPAATGSATRPRAPSPIPVTPWCWRSWCAQTATTTGRSPATRRRPMRSRSWRGHTRSSSGSHPDAEIIVSLPGLGTVLGARVLAEFGDDRTRYDDAKARKSYAGTAPITKASGKSKVVLARFARNSRLADACYLWAFSALSASPGARAFYDAHRAARGPNDRDAHSKALRALANRLVGILHGCLRHHSPYD